MNLSKNFTLEEMILSDTATRKGIDNTPSESVTDNLQSLCVHVLEPLRIALGPVVITSGYRSPEVNIAIGGVNRPGHVSQHTEGRAADFSVKGKSLAEVYNWLFANKAKVLYDQIIREFPPGGWIHVSFDPTKNRRQGLLATMVKGKTIYTPQDRPVIA